MINNFKQNFLAVLLFFVALAVAQAQNAVPAAGGEASGSGGSASYTVGQVVYSTSVGSNGSVTQGVQQPFAISVVDGIKQGANIKLECEVYPNPVTDYLKLKVEAQEFNALEELNYQLLNINGKLITTNKLNLNETKIEMLDLPQGTYFLSVTNDNLKLKTFKIIKH